MLQFFVFFVIFRIFCWTGLELRAIIVYKGLLQDILYDHNQNYIFWKSEQKHSNLYSFSQFFSSSMKIVFIF